MKQVSTTVSVITVLVGVTATLVSLWCAQSGWSYWAAFIGFMAGSNLTFALTDLRDYYRVKCGRLDLS